MAVMFGCGPNSALELVVEMPDAPIVVDRVQLYIGLGDPRNSSVERLIPRDYRYPDVPDGFYWKRDPYGALDVVDVEPGARDVRFVFQEGTHDNITVIAVGYTGERIVAAGSLVDATLESGSVRQYHVRLAAASAAFPRPTAAPVTVHRWGPGPNDTECAYLEDPSRQQKPSIFIVDHDDRDCDGLVVEDDPQKPNLECLPDVWMGSERPSREDARCVRADLIPGGTGPDAMACVLGGPGCVDGRGPGAACDPTTTCAQPAACLSCAGRADALDCLANLPTTNAATRIDCTFFAVVNAGLQLCPGTATLTQRFQFLPTCDVDAPYLMWSMPEGKWNAQSFTRNGMTFTANKPTANCDFALTVTGTPTAAGLGGIRSILNIQIANGRSGVLPVAITIADTPACNDPLVVPECRVAGDITPGPAFAACMMSKPVEPW